MITPPDAPSDPPAAGIPPADAEPDVPASEPEQETSQPDRTAEERLLESIVSDPRGDADVDETAVDDTFPVASCDPPADEQEEPPSADEPMQQNEPAPSTPEWDLPSVPASRLSGDGAAGETLRDLETQLQEFRAELQASRDESSKVTADRDDLAQRLELAAVEFDRLHQELDDARRNEGSAQNAATAAQATLAAARADAQAAQEQAETAVREREAALARLAQADANERRVRGESDALKGTLRQLQSAREESLRRLRTRAVAGASVLVILAGALGYTVGRAGSPARPSPRPAPLLAVPATVPVRSIAPLRQPTSTVVRALQPAGTATAWPAIHDPRLTVREEPNALVILFNEPLFLHGSDLTPVARQDLRRLAALLKPHAAAYRMEVEGHADASATAGGTAAAGMRELGLTRARAALVILTKEGGLPPASFSLSSSVDASPLLPGEASDARRRSRTVIIKLHGTKPVNSER